MTIFFKYYKSVNFQFRPETKWNDLCGEKKVYNFLLIRLDQSPYNP